MDVKCHLPIGNTAFLYTKINCFFIPGKARIFTFERPMSEVFGGKIWECKNNIFHLKVFVFLNFKTYAVYYISLTLILIQAPIRRPKSKNMLYPIICPFIFNLIVTFFGWKLIHICPCLPWFVTNSLGF